MKKLVCIVMCICSIVLSCAVGMSASAVSLSDGFGALNNSMLDSECPDGLDYVYFEPEVEDNEKYPLVIWLHGAKSGEYKRAQLEWYEFSRWASDEYQARFSDAGGAFLLLPRSSVNPTHNWFATDCAILKKTIDYFVSQYSDNIDTSRIYIGGYSTGGSMVYHMLVRYAEFFAAGLPICSIYSPTAADLDQLKDVSVWFFSCDQDPYLSASTASVDVSFNALASITNRPLGVRHTAFTEAVWPNGSKQNLNDAEHYIWGAVTNDMVMYSGEQYAYSRTVDAQGNSISFVEPNGVISWLSQQRTPQDTESKNFFDMIASFFKSIFMYIVSLFS